MELFKSLADSHHTKGEIMGDHRCENCGKMFYTRYVQDIGKCLCPECRSKSETAKKEKELGEAREYWEARKKEVRDF